MPLSTTVFLIELGADRTLETANEKTAANVAADASETNVEIKQLSSYINGAKPSGRKWDDWKAALTAGESAREAWEAAKTTVQSFVKSAAAAFEPDEKTSLLKSFGLTDTLTDAMKRLDHAKTFGLEQAVEDDFTT